MENYTNMLGHINSKEDFLRFMRLFREDTQDSSLEGYFEALSAWTADMEGYYANAGKPIPDNINWDFIATLLYAGSIYE